MLLIIGFVIANASIFAYNTVRQQNHYWLQLCIDCLLLALLVCLALINLCLKVIVNYGSDCFFAYSHYGMVVMSGLLTVSRLTSILYSSSDQTMAFTLGAEALLLVATGLTALNAGEEHQDKVDFNRAFASKFFGSGEEGDDARRLDVL